MDWGGFKPSSAWDFGEMSREEGGLGVQQSGGVFSVDLKLGGSMAKKMMQEPNGSSSSSGPSKRAERGVSGPQNVSCSVEGCTADLGSCRDYYRRHRVCERHSKTPVVTVRGRQVRFCQQCSRFHSLEEFDEQKRSCRKRLDGHNRRRRKPQRKPFQMSPGSFLSNLQGYSVVPTHRGVYNGHSLSASNGARLVQFRRSPMDAAAASAAGAVPTWPAKQEHDPHFTNQQTVIPNVDASGAKTFPFLLPNDHAAGRSNQTVPEVEMCRWLDNDHNVYSGELPLSAVNNSKFALSLLSTRVVSPNRPMDGGVQFDGPRSTNTGVLPYCEAFHVAPDDMLEKRASHVLPFSWK